jgi:hypothetical protein
MRQILIRDVVQNKDAIIVLDDDDLFPPWTLAKHAEALEEDFEDRQRKRHLNLIPWASGSSMTRFCSTNSIGSVSERLSTVSGRNTFDASRGLSPPSEGRNSIPAESLRRSNSPSTVITLVVARLVLWS